MRKNVEENAKILINIAQADFLFSPDEDQEPRYIQAFLLQSSIIEGLIREYANDQNKKNKIQGVKQARNFHQSCREARVSGGINKKTFDKLSAYIDFRNNLVHRILEKDDLPGLEIEINKMYGNGSDIINTLLN